LPADWKSRASIKVCGGGGSLVLLSGRKILLNRRMDRPEIPQYVVEYVLYHEMLHVKHPTRKSGCSLISHSGEFRAEEKLFPEFERARKALDKLARERRLFWF
jgi:predicted metal-dependent hydrolase